MADVSVEDTNSNTPKAGERMVPIEQVQPNPDQPRKDFGPEELAELSRSIEKNGIIQPLIVRESKANSIGYEIIAGERRWRAAQMAKLHEVPVVVRDLNDQEVLEVAIIENIQRADLNPVEEALAFQQLQDKFGHTQEQLSEALGKSRSHIANLLRLLKLPGDVLQWLREGKLSAGHARAVLMAEDPSAVAASVISQQLSVRDTEKLIKTLASPAQRKPSSRNAAPEKDADTRALEGDLSATLGIKVEIENKPGTERGIVKVHYSDFAQLDDLCRRLTQTDQD